MEVEERLLQLKHEKEKEWQEEKVHCNVAWVCGPRSRSLGVTYLVVM